MKKIIALFALVMLMCVACQREYELKSGDTFSGQDGLITYRCNLGKDFETALEALRVMYGSIYSWEYQVKPTLKIDFPYDSRLFYKVRFNNGIGVIESDVLDSKGNWYGYQKNMD